jgi:hypothetical protein
MKDLEVDDDEWQLAAWFFQDQDKQVPLATLDYHQDLFAVTGTFRAQELDEESHVAFSRTHFYDMFGPFPETFDKNTDMDQLVACPYEYDATNMEFTNKITGGHPFIFHFAGNDWLCACKVFAETGFQNVPNKFRENCEKRHSFWYNRVEDGILHIAASADDSEVLQLHRDTVNIEEDIFVQEERRLERMAEIQDRNLYSARPNRRPIRFDGREMKVEDISPYRNIFRPYLQYGDSRNLLEEEMDRDLQSIQPYHRPIRHFFRRGDDRKLLDVDMDRDLQIVQPYSQKASRSFHSFWLRGFFEGGDDRELAHEELNRELKRIKPYKSESDDRDLVEEHMDRDLQSVSPYRRPIRRFFLRFFQRGDDRD